MPLETVMPQPRIQPLATFAVRLAAPGACAKMKPPAMNNGPALSTTGVQVAVVRQLCGESSVTALDTWIDETVELQVRNGSPGPVSVHRDKLRLLGPNGGVFTTGASPTDLLTVPNGGTETFEVTFTAHGGLDCGRPMQLDPSTAITSQESAVALPPVSFVPLASR